MDLSKAHPVQRAILFGLRYLVGLSILLAFVSQYRWVDIRQQTPIGYIGIVTDKDAVVFVQTAFQPGMQFGTSVHWGPYSGSAVRIRNESFGELAARMPPRKRYGTETGYFVFSFPGVAIWQAGPSTLPDRLSVAFINHGWIILSTIVGFFTARHVVLRSTRAKPQGAS